jgi:hypothetical protein
MSTYSDTTRAIDRKQTNTLLFAVMVLALALTTSCSMSLVDETPELLRYCRVAERSDTSSSPDSAGQTPQPADDEAAGGCTADADQTCDDDAVEAITRGEVVNCDP